MNPQGWDQFETWHKLLDALCNRRGWYDNTQPAGELCAHLGKNRRQDFEAAKKKLRTWRSGQRLPLRRNLAALAQLLEVESDPKLERRWLTLYRLAQKQGSDGSPASAADPAGAPANGMRLIQGWTMAGMALLFGSGLVFASVKSNREAAFRSLPTVNFEGRVRVPVGVSHLIFGALSGCDRRPPGWEQIAAEMPATSLGVFSDGGLAREVVRACGKEVIVRGVRFTGQRPGTDEIRLFGSYIKLDVVLATQ
ncbi:hypothetical protein [Nitratireductor sp. ZSWI3]|uniref:hypothetical protein n=1 Tax=Nitratireductor sp. ZSWI3 TaxID=2966359 RepID=UPI00214FDB4C|nr:hypothetical protein [Nitratireductor sp. ZSWI3]MCR4265605.1 hypothetical protein [Nitratireductor sp. ZSWI3]